MAKNYVRNTEGLRRYHEARREAKALGGAYRDYVNQYYKVSKGLRTRGVKLKATNARVLTASEFNIITKAEGIRGSKLVAEQFGLLSGNQARQLQSVLKSRGFDISLQRAMTRQLSQREWNNIDAYYMELKSQGLSSEAAKVEISTYFFGS